MNTTGFNGCSLEFGVITQETQLLTLRIDKHSTWLMLLLTIAPNLPLILGFPWLQHNYPHIDWLSPLVAAWGQSCLGVCRICL